MTSRQAQVLTFLRTWFSMYETSPSYQEIAEGCGIKGKSQIKQHLDALKAQGLITFTPYTARTVKLVLTADARAMSVIKAAENLLDNIKNEKPKHNKVTVCGKAFADLDIAVAEYNGERR